MCFYRGVVASFVLKKEAGALAGSAIIRIFVGDSRNLTNMKKTCCRSFALIVMLFALFAPDAFSREAETALPSACPGAACGGIPVQAQQLGIEVTPRQPRVFQEFEVSYTASGEIESIAQPHWGALTLVRELGRSQGSQMSIVNGVTTRSDTYAYRYLVRSPVSGDVTVPGTTAVVGGRTCRCEGLVVTIRPDTAAVQPQCRLEPDTAAMARTGGYVVRLVCDRKPDQAQPLLMVNGVGCMPFSTGYSAVNGEEEYVYRYRIDSRGAERCTLVPQLSFGGKPFAVSPYVFTLKAGARNGRWTLYVLSGVVILLWGAVFVRDRAVPAGRHAVVSRFSWRGYMLAATTLLFFGFSALLVYFLSDADAKTPFSVVLAAGLMLFASCWLLFGELRRSAVRLCIDGEALFVTPYMGLGPTRRYDLRSFDGITSSVLVSRGGAYEYRYLMQANRRTVRISSFYLKNYGEVADAAGQGLPYMGERPMSLWLELKEIFG